MPRNGSGIYIPPTGNPVASGTTITSGWGNGVIADLGNEVTNSLPRDGSAPLTGVLKITDGSVSAPALTFSSETGTGFFRRGANDIVLSIGGVARTAFTPTGINAANLGETTRGTAKVTTLDASDAVTLASTLAVTGTSTLTGATTITGALTLANGVTGVTKAMVGLANADNTSDVNKPISTAVQAAINALYELVAPAGSVEYFAMSTAPAGYLKANGQAVSRTTFARLFAQIGTFHGAGDGSTTFNVPDLRGVFPRGWDDGRGQDSGRAFGSYQADGFASHGHGVSDPGHAHSVYDPGHLHGASSDAQGEHVHDRGTKDAGGGFSLSWNDRFVNEAVIRGNGGYPTDARGNHAHNIGIGGSGTGIGIYGAGTNISIQANGIGETRPRNVALLACIRF